MFSLRSVLAFSLGALLAACGEQPDRSKSEQSDRAKPVPPAVVRVDPSNSAQSISPKDAVRYDGKVVTVCGVVSSARYLAESTGRASSHNPTFLNFGGKFPNHDFTAVIFEDNREKFGEPEKSCLNKNVCVTGKVQIYREKPEVVLTEPEQLKGC